MALGILQASSFKKDEVVLAVTNGAFGGGHLGLGFHSARNGPQILHLEWHKKLSVHTIPDELVGCWIAVPLMLPPLVSKTIVAMARTVATRGPSINFGINFIAAQGSFSPNGSYKPPKGSDGLTCATFVVEVLRAAMIELVQATEWKAHPANVEWANAVCNSLANTHDVDQAHVDAVRRNINGLRLRPFEVAGAACLDKKLWPATFDAVQEPAVSVQTGLCQLCQTKQSAFVVPASLARKYL